MKQLSQPLLVSSSTLTENRLDVLLALRGLACLMVVIAHCNPPRAFLVYHTFDLSWLLFSAGGVAVRIFFCLSGYLMGKAFYTKRYSMNRAGIFNFWRNRALRVLPLYYFSLLITGLFVYPTLLNRENWFYLLRIISFTYDQTLPVAFNGALWTLSTEVQFYLIVPPLFWFFTRSLRSKKQIIYSGLLVILGLLILRFILWFSIQDKLQHPEDAIAFVRYIYVPIWMNLDVFLCGFLVNFWPPSRASSSPLPERGSLSQRQDNIKNFRGFLLSKYKINLKLISTLSLLALYFLTAYLKYYEVQILGLISPTLTLLATGFFIYAFEKHDLSEPLASCRRPLSLKACRKSPIRLLEVLGVLSYGIYIWHLPILAKIQLILTSDIPIYAYIYRFSATVILSMILATFTYFAIELPMANLKRFKQRSAVKS